MALYMGTMEEGSSRASVLKSTGILVMNPPSSTEEGTPVEVAMPGLLAMTNSLVETYTNAFYTSLGTLVRMAMERGQPFNLLKRTVNFAIDSIRNVDDRFPGAYLE
ncbi:hypothetical protein M6B38_263850 [Iris pallida]|uniref:Uncharacterized protein n=1 Tax=Iris pallida TaxID=29817 RepID=A0AAX6IC23_IRIPA|nr:hypothetical protein M6B38_263850 [Iris pallida]